MQRVLSSLNNQMSPKLAGTPNDDRIARPKNHLCSTSFVRKSVLHDSGLWVGDFPIASDSIRPAWWHRRGSLRIKSEEGAGLLNGFHITPVVELFKAIASLLRRSTIIEVEAGTRSTRLGGRRSRYRLWPWSTWLARSLMLICRFPPWL